MGEGWANAGWGVGCSALLGSTTHCVYAYLFSVPCPDADATLTLLLHTALVLHGPPSSPQPFEELAAKDKARYEAEKA